MLFSRRSELQARLDVERILQQLRSVSESDRVEPCEDPAPTSSSDFCMSGLFGIIPGTDPSPIPIDSALQDETTL